MCICECNLVLEKRKNEKKYILRNHLLSIFYILQVPNIEMMFFRNKSYL